MRKKFILFIFVVLAFVLSPRVSRGDEMMKITSPDFAQQESIPAKFTCQGENINPALAISGVPEGTQSLALVVDDPDAPVGLWVHWVLYNIDSDTDYIDQNSVYGMKANNSWGKEEYGGPCPPNGEHRYFFKLYALDTAFDEEISSKKDLDKVMAGHILEQTELVGLYEKH